MTGVANTLPKLPKLVIENVPPWISSGFNWRARAREAGAADRFEAETVAFFERVRAGYLELARREPRRFQVLDATAALAAVEARVEGLLEALS